jgi:hypothetical protein
LYVQLHGGALADLEYAFWPQLVATIESCKELADSMPHQPALRVGLINRYRAVTALLDDEFASVSRHLCAGADAILLYNCHDANLRLLQSSLPDRVSRLIRSFVCFHEQVYAHPHTTEEGEYSV